MEILICVFNIKIFVNSQTSRSSSTMTVDNADTHFTANKRCIGPCIEICYPKLVKEMTERK